MMVNLKEALEGRNKKRRLYSILGVMQKIKTRFYGNALEEFFLINFFFVNIYCDFISINDYFIL